MSTSTGIGREGARVGHGAQMLRPKDRNRLQEVIRGLDAAERAARWPGSVVVSHNALRTWMGLVRAVAKCKP